MCKGANCADQIWWSAVPGSKFANCAATMRVRSTTRARRLLVPSAKTEEAFVRIAGATMAVSTANGLPATALYCKAEPSWFASAAKFVWRRMLVLFQRFVDCGLGHGSHQGVSFFIRVETI